MERRRFLTLTAVGAVGVSLPVFAGLPNGKIPDRTDFQSFKPSDRMVLWRQVVSECKRLGDELHDVLEKGELESRLRPL